MQRQTLDIANFTLDTLTQTDYYIPGGINFVCEVESQTEDNYRYGSGTLAQQKVTTYIKAVTSVTNISGYRRAR